MTNLLPPQTVAPREPSDEEPYESSWRVYSQFDDFKFLIWLLVSIIGYIIIWNIETPTFGHWLVKTLYYLSPCIAGLIVLNIITDWDHNRCEEKSAKRKVEVIAAHRQNMIERSENEARLLTEQLRNQYNEALYKKQNYYNLLDASRSEMIQAQTELDRNASVFFWE